MSKAAVHLPVVGLGNTQRTDNWWAGPLATAVVLLGFIAYATFRAFENKYFRIGETYLSPFYSPYIPVEGWGIPLFTPAMLILPSPASFRLTCYYYRKAYYRSLAWDPPACAVGERAPQKYNGERGLLLFQNLHRYTLYLAILVLSVLWYDAFKALRFEGTDGAMHFGIGLGTVIMFVNVFLLTSYTFGCHSLRHLVGGRINSYSTEPLGKVRYTVWTQLSKLNRNHQLFAWLSLFSVMGTDIYIRSVASGLLHDVRIL